MAGSDMDWKAIAAHVDHTNLKITAKQESLEQLCKEAKHFGFASVCVQPCYVKLCAELLKDAPDTKVCTVVGFPHGYNTPETKVAETKFACKDGATEIDMVINICKAKDGKWDYIEDEVRRVVEAAGKDNVVKVILETDQLTDEEVQEACKACARAKSHFIKTSTGFNGRANEKVVKLMRATAPDEMKIKAAGGIRNVKDAKNYIGLGCSRLGMSGSVNMILEAGAPPLPGQKRKLEGGSESNSKKQKTSDY